MSQKLEALSTTLNKTQTDLRSLNATYNKVTKRLTVKEEENAKFEKDINSEIAVRIGEIIKQRGQMDKEIKNIKDTLKRKE